MGKSQFSYAYSYDFQWKLEISELFLHQPTYNHQPPSQVSSLTWTGYPFYKKNNKFLRLRRFLLAPPWGRGGGASKKRPTHRKFIVFFVKRVACPSETAYLRWWLVVVGRFSYSYVS